MSKIQLRPYQKTMIREITECFARGIKRPCVVAPCGSGKTVMAAWFAEHSKGNVLFLVHRRELLEQTERMFDEFEISREKVQVASVFKLARNPELIREPLIVICDEHHHSTAKTWDRVLSLFPDAYVIGLTATPCRMDGNGLGSVSDTLIQGITVRELIDQGYLANYDLYAPQIGLDWAGIDVRYGDYVQSEVEARIDKPAIYGDVIKHYRQFADGKQAIVYCASLAHSQATADAFNGAGIPAKHIDGNTPKSERQQAIEEFRRGEIQALCNMDLISEGLDVPGCECCILLRPTKSLALYIQQSMRCMRPAPGKRAVILDFVGNAYRHGLPDEDREWSLDGRYKTRAYHEGGEMRVRQCPKCYYTHRVKAVCPKCGFVYPKTERELKEEKEAELRKVEEIQKKQKRMEVGMAKTYGDLLSIARERGYKDSWAYVMAKKKGLILK